MKKFLIMLMLSQSVSGMPADRAASKIDTLMNSYYENGLFDGVVLVSEKGRIVYLKAFGLADREWNVPMTTDTKFKIGSISKPFTALLILQLVQEGLINLDGTIADYLPDYQGQQKDKITIHHLLTHTSGLLNMLSPEEEAVKERLHHDLRELIKYPEEAALYFEPGSAFHYSNFGYNVLACIAEQVTGKSFAELLNEKIFEPAGMTNTREYEDTQIEERLARGYEYKLLNGYENATWFDNSYAAGSGGIVSTAEDLYRMHQALMTDALLSEILKNKMFAPPAKGEYGYGWALRKMKIDPAADTLFIAEHTGSVNGFGSYMAQMLTDTSLVVVLKNSRADTYISPAYAPEIGQKIISILYGQEVPLPGKSIARHIGYYLGKYGFERAKDEYYRIRKQNSGKYSLDEFELNQLGIELFFRFNRPDDALGVFALNMAEFPRSYNTYDSYAYILMQKKDYVRSIAYYRQGLKVLQMYPEENDSPQVLKDAQNALKSIEEMEEKAGLKK